jgi:hypothetical protein
MIHFMADRHQYRAITPRLPDDLREQFQRAAAEQDATMTGVIVSLIRWWLRIPGAKLPERPPRHSPAS